MKLPAWATAEVISLAAISVLAALLVRQCDRTSAVEAESRRIETSARLAEAGIQEAKIVSARELAADRNLSQRRLADALTKLHLNSTPVFSATGTTGPVTAGGVPLAQAPGSAQASPAVGPLPAAGEPACLLRAGESGEIRVSAAGARVKAGNIAVDAQADAYANGQHLFGGPLRLDVKVSPREPEPRATGLGIGWGLTVGDRLRTGPVIPLPTSQWWHIQGDYSLSVQCSPGRGICEKDTVQFGVQGIWRWR